MQLFVTDDGKKAFAAGMASNRLERNIMMVRRRAIWSNRNPDIAERQYRAKVALYEKQKKNT